MLQDVISGGSRGGAIRPCPHWCSHRAFVSTSKTPEAFLYYLIIGIFQLFCVMMTVK